MRRIMPAVISLCLLSGCRLQVQGSTIVSQAQADSSRTNKVATIMAANDITVGDVADYVAAYGWALVRAPLPSARWTPAKPGTAEVAYYLFELRGAIADTALQFYLPQIAGAVSLRVRAVDENNLIGAWSDVGVSRGAVLPGVGF